MMEAVTHLGKNGELTNEQDQRCCAKIKEYPKKTLYFIKFLNNRMFDPTGIDSGKERSMSAFFSFKLVTKETFDFYSHYLKTKSKNSFTRAERSYITNV